MKWYDYTPTIISCVVSLSTITYIYFYKKNKKTKNRFKVKYQDLKNLNLNFGKNFLFGIATSSYQNEGSNKNNWSKFEEDKNLEKCNLSCDMWNLFDIDLKNMVYLGIKSFRFSLEWSRIQPKSNRGIDYKPLYKYEEWCKKLIENNIEPILTLHHFTLPEWVEKDGGLLSENFVKYYYNYVDIVSSRLYKYVNIWITFNEPFLECLHGYILGTRPPCIKNDFIKFKLCLKNICIAHSRVYHLLHFKNNKCKVSIAKNIAIFKPNNNLNIAEILFSYQMNKFYNYSIINSLITGRLYLNLYPSISKITDINIDEKYELMKNTLDFIGVNHYNVVYIKLSLLSDNKIDMILGKNDKRYPQNDMNWDMVPYSLYISLKDIYRKYNLPICITENGACDNDINSTKKTDYLVQCLYCVSECISENVNIIGYNYWTLCDNFEWEFGYKPRFGLYRVDFEKIKEQFALSLIEPNNKRKKINTREITLTGKVYRSIIKNIS